MDPAEAQRLVEAACARAEHLLERQVERAVREFEAKYLRPLWELESLCEDAFFDDRFEGERRESRRLIADLALHRETAKPGIDVLGALDPIRAAAIDLRHDL